MRDIAYVTVMMIMMSTSIMAARSYVNPSCAMTGFTIIYIIIISSSSNRNVSNSMIITKR